MNIEISNPAISLLEDTLEHYGISKNQAAIAMNIPRSRLTDITKGRKGFSIDTALRLEKYLGVEARLWLDLQHDYDLELAKKAKKKEIWAEVCSL